MRQGGGDADGRLRHRKEEKGLLLCKGKKKRRSLFLSAVANCEDLSKRGKGGREPLGPKKKLLPLRKKKNRLLGASSPGPGEEKGGGVISSGKPPPEGEREIDNRPLREAFFRRKGGKKIIIHISSTKRTKIFPKMGKGRRPCYPSFPDERGGRRKGGGKLSRSRKVFRKKNREAGPLHSEKEKKGKGRSFISQGGESVLGVGRGERKKWPSRSGKGKREKTATAKRGSPTRSLFKKKMHSSEKFINAGLKKGERDAHFGRRGRKKSEQGTGTRTLNPHKEGKGKEDFSRCWEDLF